MKGRRRPNGSAGARATISLPIALMARLRRFPHLNVSAVCTEALATAVEREEVEAAWQEFVALATGTGAH